jgi:hypothetical protein
MMTYKYKGIKCRDCGNENPHCSCRPLNVTWGGFPIQLQEKWHEVYAANRPNKTFDRATIKEAIELHRKGYYQSSRKYMMVSLSLYDSIELSKNVFDCFRRIQRTLNYYKWRKL